MNVVGWAAVAFVLSALSATSIQATDSITGRWAADPSACSSFGGTAAQSPLIVTSYGLRWSTESCRIGRMYKTGETIHIQAMCRGEGGEKSIPVSLHPQGGRLSVGWNRGARSTLQRCP